LHSHHYPLVSRQLRRPVVSSLKDDVDCLPGLRILRNFEARIVTMRLFTSENRREFSDLVQAMPENWLAQK
jgi:hypothetical protein